MMNCKGLLTALVALVVAMTFSACETGPAPKPVLCQSDDIRIGDIINISFLDIPMPIENKDFQVGSDGTINMPLIGPVKALGKKFSDFETEMQKRYVPQYYTRLTLIVKPGTRFFFVSGEVKQPGRQVYSGETTVLRAIASAGDFTEFASKGKVQIHRATGATEIIDCKKAIKKPEFDRTICPGDNIIVPRSL
jgi:protein involved in polysaccharide export with SLBB domain